MINVDLDRDFDLEEKQEDGYVVTHPVLSPRQSGLSDSGACLTAHEFQS